MRLLSTDRTSWPGKHLRRTIEIEGKQVLVFDALFPPTTMRLLYEFLRGSSFSWRTTDGPASAHSIRWSVRIDTAAASAMPFFGDVTRIVTELGQDAGPLRLGRIYANFNLYGEIHYPHKDGANVVTALYYANVEWDDEWQGETVFYEGGEPAYVVPPRPGRLVVFDGRIKHRGSPPSRESFEPRLTIAFKYGYGAPRGQVKATKTATAKAPNQTDSWAAFYRRVIRKRR